MASGFLSSIPGVENSNHPPCGSLVSMQGGCKGCRERRGPSHFSTKCLLMAITECSKTLNLDCGLGVQMMMRVIETYTNGETLNVPSMANKGKVSTDNKIP